MTPRFRKKQLRPPPETTAQLRQKPLAQVIAEILRLRVYTLAPNTVRNWERVASHAEKLLPSSAYTIEDINLENYQNKRLEQHAARSTIAAEMSVILTALRFCGLTPHPKLMPRNEMEERPGIALTLEQQQLLLQEAALQSPILHLCIELGLHGMRIGEILGLRIQDYDPTKETLTIRTSKTPAGHRTIPLTGEAPVLLKKRITQLPSNPGWPIFPGRDTPNQTRRDIEKPWRRLRATTGLKQIRFHDLRHTTITELLEQGTPERTIMALVGHVDERMLKRYSHIRQDAMRNALQKRPARTPQERKQQFDPTKTQLLTPKTPEEDETK